MIIPYTQKLAKCFELFCFSYERAILILGIWVSLEYNVTHEWNEISLRPQTVASG